MMQNDDPNRGPQAPGDTDFKPQGAGEKLTVKLWLATAKNKKETA